MFGSNPSALSGLLGGMGNASGASGAMLGGVGPLSFMQRHPIFSRFTTGLNKVGNAINSPLGAAGISMLMNNGSFLSGGQAFAQAQQARKMKEQDELLKKLLALGVLK